MLIQGQLDKQTKTSNKTKIKNNSAGYPEGNSRKETNKMAKRNNKEMFNIPEMSNYDANEDAKNFKNTQEALGQEDNIDGMDFEAMKGEETYVSPEEASPEALKKIKAMKVGGFVNAVLGRIEAH